MTTCPGCDTPVVYGGVGCPPTFCSVACRKRAKRAAHRVMVAEREPVAQVAAPAKRPAVPRVLCCDGCGARLRRASRSGLCGFCEIEAVA